MIREERGITLVELLGALALMSIVLLLMSSAHFFGQRQFHQQSVDMKHQEEVRFVMRRMTSDVREVGDHSVDLVNDKLYIGEVTYQLTDQSLLRDGKVISEYIEQLNVELNEDKIELSVISRPNNRGKKAELSTTIYYRK